MKKILLVLTLGLGYCSGDTTIAPSAVPIPSPLPVSPINYLVTAIATQGGPNNVTQDVNAGEIFKTSITGVQCFQDEGNVKCPPFGGYLWRLKTLGLGLCDDAGSVNSPVDSWLCFQPTVPASVEIEGCVLDFSRTILGCASVKVRVH